MPTQPRCTASSKAGKLRMEPTTHGAHAICILPSGKEVDEWAYYRQHHPIPQP
ncbi:DUF333 domain-containing protein [Comamonas sp. UBA7840]|uniref:DUF333 domain-containing protein n=1 Tax=Comamonas sp. UBA7840 TaxID=1946392 RepID=UPI0039C856FC